MIKHNKSYVAKFKGHCTIHTLFTYINVKQFNTDEKVLKELTRIGKKTYGKHIELVFAVDNTNGVIIYEHKDVN